MHGLINQVYSHIIDCSIVYIEILYIHVLYIIIYIYINNTLIVFDQAIVYIYAVHKHAKLLNAILFLLNICIV